MNRKYIITALILTVFLFCGCEKSKGNFSGPQTEPIRTASLQSPPDSVKIKSLLAIAGESFKKGDIDRAISLYDEVLNMDGTLTEALQGKADCFISQKKWAQALPLLDRLLSIDPDNTNGLLSRAVVHLEMKNQDRYLQDAKRAGKNSPFTFRTKIELGRALVHGGKYDEAVVLLNQAMKLAGSADEKNQVLIALMYAGYYDGKKEKALQIAEKVRKNTGDRKMILQCLLMELITNVDLDRFEKARTAYAEIIKIDPDLRTIHDSYLGERGQAMVYKKMGHVYHMEGHFEKALDFYDRAVSLDPDNSQGRLERSILLLNMHRLDEAQNSAKAWAATSPPEPVTSEELDDYAKVYVLLGKKEKSLDMINRAIKKNPGHYHLGSRALIYAYLGDEEQARKDFTRYRKQSDEEEQKYSDKIRAFWKTRF